MDVDDLVLAGGRLRRWQPDDAPVLVRAWTDADVARWNPVPDEATPETAERWIDGVARRQANRLAIDFVIDSAAHGAVGEVGLSGFNARYRAALIGYWLLPEGRGQGLATQALRSVTGWAHEALDLDLIVARCHRSNANSQAVAARAGYVHEATDTTGHALWRSRRRAQEPAT